LAGLLSVMLYSFAGAMRCQDYFGQGSRSWLRLHEKGGKRHDLAAHHRAAASSRPTWRRPGSTS